MVPIADKYWVNGAGSWSDSANHWSASSGGAPGAGVPTSTEDVEVDNNSGFAGANQFVNVNVSANCRNFVWNYDNAAQGAGLRTFTGVGLTWNIFGSMTFNDGPDGPSGLTRWFGSTTGTIQFRQTTGGSTIQLKGNTFRAIFGMNATAGDYTLQDALTPVAGITISSGEFKTNGQTVNGSTFIISSVTTAIVTLGASAINLSGGANAWQAGVLCVVNAGTSTITLTGASAEFTGGGKTYNNVVFTNTPTTVAGSNTISSLTVSAGMRVNYTSGTTQTITTLNAVGTSASNILFRTTAAGTASLCVTTWNVEYVDVQNIVASCATVRCTTCIDNGGNTGWFFTPAGAAFLLHFVNYINET